MIDSEKMYVTWQNLAEKFGYPAAATIAADAVNGIGVRRLFAELLIAFSAGRIAEENATSSKEIEWSCGRLDVQPISRESFGDSEEIPLCGNDWLLSGKPEGTVLPPPSGRRNVRTPNLNSANPSFAALLIRHVRDKYGGDAPTVYRAAHVSRQTYSSIISNELRPVSKQTAISFAIALRLNPVEAEELLRAAGHALSEFILEDIIYQTCIIAGIYDIDEIESILSAHGVTIPKDIPF